MKNLLTMSESLQLFTDDFKGSRFLSRMIGLDIFTETEFKINTVTVINFISALSYVLDQFYSFYYFRNDFDNFCFCCVTTGYGWQVSIIIYI